MQTPTASHKFWSHSYQSTRTCSYLSTSWTGCGSVMRDQLVAQERLITGSQRKMCLTIRLNMRVVKKLNRIIFPGITGLPSVGSHLAFQRDIPHTHHQQAATAG